MKQIYENYTSADLEVWNILFTRQIKNLQDKACSAYLDALTKMQEVLNADELPNFQKINNWFKNHTGWQIECVPGLIPVQDFFVLLSQKKFPSSTWLRSLDKLDYLEEPDMFHDIFGHIPLLSDSNYSDFMLEFGKLGTAFLENENHLKALQRLYWFAIEFGLIKENDCTKIYGAGILSSFGESNSSIVNINHHLKFNIEQILATDFCTSEMQTDYFVMDHLIQLNESINHVSAKWNLHELETGR
jgi:phenylalanine-4-hydroxylase